ERKIQFYDGNSYDPYDPYSSPPDGFIDLAVLIVGGDTDNSVREVQYDIEREKYHDFFSK
ncbi:MAG: hypothetical protein MI740_13175, partial [Halanaerobiales bacterium]|nr:hypothetical protein [Halanaerobiales bacterium]